MKNFRISLFPVLVMMIMPFNQACKDTIIERREYMANVPQYMSYTDLRKSFKSETPYAINTPGKIYIYGQYLFINEKYKGIHVFDNTNPSKPVNVAFYSIPGNVDLAVRNNYLYADSYVDLVVIDINDIRVPKEVARVKDIFPYTIPELKENYVIKEADQTKGVITGWKVEKVKVDVVGGSPGIMYDGTMGIFTASSFDKATNSTSSQTIGVGGSLARFIIYGDKFYGLNQWRMQVIDINQPEKPVAGSVINLFRMAETVFIEGSNLFIGTQTGMLIYNLANPAIPVKLSEFAHFQSCDPVVAQDKIAYVTMHAGNRCGTSFNQMDVLDISNLSSPKLLKSYSMKEPWGLGIDKKILFVCDGSAGLKIYDASDPLQIDNALIKNYTDMVARDVIPLNGLLIMIADDGLYQYDYSNLLELNLLSFIPFG